LDEEVVHHADPAGRRGRPGEEDGGEADRSVGLVAGDQLEALVLRVGDQRARHVEQRLARRIEVVEVAVGAHQRQQLGEVALADYRDDSHATTVTASVPAA
jgi:hypothetical protein